MWKTPWMDVFPGNMLPKLTPKGREIYNNQ